MRSALKQFNEDTLFSPVRYRVDLFFGKEDDLYSQAFCYEPLWNSIINEPVFQFDHISQELEKINQVFEFGAPSIPIISSFFTPKEKEVMLKELIFDDQVVYPEKCDLQVLDICLAYCYENRMCQHDFSSESHYMIRKLSSTLSWFEEFQSLDQVLSSYTRRCLTYPYLRRWDLCCKAAVDCALLIKDTKWVLKCLLELRDLFQKKSNLYLLNRLYLDDMCVWIQRVTKFPLEEEIRSKILEQFDFNKRKLPGLELIKWNLSKASSPRTIDEKKLLTSHFVYVTNSSKDLAIPFHENDRNFVEELD